MISSEGVRNKDARIHLRVSSRLLREMRQYARRNSTTLTALVEEAFREILRRDTVLRSLNKTQDDVEQI